MPSKVPTASVASLAGGRSPGRLRELRERLGRQRWTIGQGGAAGGADLAMTVDAQFDSVLDLGAGDGRGVAVIDGLLEPAFGGAALEPGATPTCHRKMRHIGVDIDAGHQAAAKAETAGHRIVMDFVLGRFCGVEGFDPIGAERASGHGTSS